MVDVLKGRRRQEIRLINGKPHLCTTIGGIITKDLGEYDKSTKKICGLPYYTEDQLTEKYNTSDEAFKENIIKDERERLKKERQKREREYEARTKRESRELLLREERARIRKMEIKIENSRKVTDEELTNVPKGGFKRYEVDLEKELREKGWLIDRKTKQEEPKEVVKDEVKEVVKDEVKEVVKDEVKEVVKDEVKEVVKDEVKEVVKDEVKEVVKDEVKEVVKEESGLKEYIDHNKLAEERDRKLALIHEGHSVDVAKEIVKLERKEGKIMAEKRVIYGKARSCRFAGGKISQVYDDYMHKWLSKDEFDERHGTSKDKNVKVEVPKTTMTATTGMIISNSKEGDMKQIEKNKIEDNKIEENKIEENKIEDKKVEEKKVEQKKVEHANIVDEYINLLYMNG